MLPRRIQVSGELGRPAARGRPRRRVPAARTWRPGGRVRRAAVQAAGGGSGGASRAGRGRRPSAASSGVGMRVPDQRRTGCPGPAAGRAAADRAPRPRRRCRPARSGPHRLRGGRRRPPPGSAAGPGESGGRACPLRINEENLGPCGTRQLPGQRVALGPPGLLPGARRRQVGRPGAASWCQPARRCPRRRAGGHDPGGQAGQVAARHRDGRYPSPVTRAALIHGTAQAGGERRGLPGGRPVSAAASASGSEVA